MPGLDQAVLDSVEPESVFRRICVDLRTDFIVAPHYLFIFEHASTELWGRLYKQLKSGTYEPELPLTIAVPKPGGFTRPGSILHPFDRVIYHALTELAAPKLEANLDRDRVFSHVWLPYGDGDQMFKPEQGCWEALRSKLAGLAENGGYFVKADVAHYFERIPQHDLINLIRASDCLPGLVNLLEELLLAFRERNSFGIIQGVFPSDLLGNFFLSKTDAHFDLLDVQSARFVDDIYLYYKSKSKAQKGMFELTEHLRQSGLNLNENKSGVISAASLIREETALDRLFSQAHESVQEQLRWSYGFDAGSLDSNESQSDTDVSAVETLFHSVRDFPKQADKIVRFCLPVLRAAKSPTAVEYVLENLVAKPYLSRLYLGYLQWFLDSEDVRLSLEKVISTKNFIPDYQLMYIFAALMRAPKTSRESVKLAIKTMSDSHKVPALRAIAAICSAIHGTPSAEAIRQTGV